jgi:pimeloyl-ACP methyl ester carboxylesterase
MRLMRLPRRLLMAALIAPGFVAAAGTGGEIPDKPFGDSRFETVDGVRVHWRERIPAAPGDRPLVVLIHGFGGSAFSWRHTLEALEQAGYPCVAVDLPPFGYSERTGEGPSWAELVAGVADRVAPGRPLKLVGHSMGAGVAAEVAAAAPDRVELLVLAAGTPGLRGTDSGWFSLALDAAPVREAIEAWARWQLLDETSFKNSLASAFGREPTEAEIEGYRQPLTIPGTFTALLARLERREGGAPEGWQQVPLAVVWGENDRWVPIDRIRPWLEDHPNLQAFDTLAEAAHNPMDTHPEAFNDWLIEQLQAAP